MEYGINSLVRHAITLLMVVTNISLLHPEGSKSKRFGHSDICNRFNEAVQLDFFLHLLHHNQID